MVTDVRPTHSSRNAPTQDARPTRGRPRDTGRDLAILNATMDLLTELGYDQLSIESIAARAGVTRATVYRRYPDKATLVAAAAESRSTGTPPAIDARDLREGLLGAVQWLAREIAEQELGVLSALFTGMRTDPQLATAMRRILRRDQAAMSDASFRGAIERGDHPAPQAAELFAEIVPAVIVHRLVITGEPCDQDFLEHLVDDVLLPLIQGR